MFVHSDEGAEGKGRERLHQQGVRGTVPLKHLNERQTSLINGLFIQLLVSWKRVCIDVDEVMLIQLPIIANVNNYSNKCIVSRTVLNKVLK